MAGRSASGLGGMGEPCGVGGGVGGVEGEREAEGPFGDVAWRRRTAKRLGLGSSLRERGRPRVRPIERLPTPLQFLAREAQKRLERKAVVAPPVDAAPPSRCL